MMDVGIARGGDYVLRKEQIDYVFKELDWYAEERRKQADLGIATPIEVGIDGTRRSDGLIPPGLKERLLVCVKKLKNIPDNLKDWHPSSKQVLDLVHPSSSKVRWDERYCLQKFQWLPTDFDISCEGKVEMKSYINNLHPVEHSDMYSVLEEIFEKFIPLFEDVLAEMSTIYTKEHDWPLIAMNLADIELTPEDPKYTGGNRHVEGMANENIVASGIY
ncbi:hypothetical protein BGX28_009646 [Mortierella sp. GBA30]|nr:hypothetical protein BGX28_009646 [Mortierella sp. GBA30]